MSERERCSGLCTCDSESTYLDSGDTNHYLESGDTNHCLESGDITTSLPNRRVDAGSCQLDARSRACLK